MNRLQGLFRRNARRSSAVRRPRSVFVEQLETRQLLAGGPLTVVISEVGAPANSGITIIDNGVNDSDPILGSIGYSTPANSPFADFKISGLSVQSNRILAETYGFTGATLGMSGQVTRTTTSGGIQTLKIVATDTGFASPSNLTALKSSASGTFTNPISGDHAVFLSTVDTASNTIQSDPVTLLPGDPVSSAGKSAPTVTLNDVAPFNLTSEYDITLNPSASAATTIRFQNTALSSISGNNQPVTVGDFVWNDANANGIQDAGESGINGVTLTLTGTDIKGNTVTDHATTSGNGAYLFTEAPGTYTVTVDASNFTAGGALAAYTATFTGKGTTATDSNANPSGTSPGFLPGGSSDLTVDFGYYQKVTVGDFVWNDANANGIQDAGEAGINGVTLTLTGTDGSGNSVTDHATTSGNGAYLFTEAPGTYTVTVDASNFTAGGALAAYTASAVNSPGSTTANDSNANPSGTNPGTLPGGSSDLTVDFGYYKPQLGQISGTKFLDVTGNGFSADDTPFKGVTIKLTDSSGRSVTTQTASDGSYSFTGLAAGTYKVSEVVPDGYIQTGPTSLDSNVTISNGAATYTVVVGAGQSVSGKDFDNAEKCDLSDFTCITYTVDDGCRTTHPRDLRGNTNQGNTVTVTFKYTGTEQYHPVTLVSYTAPGSTFVASQASQQKIFQQDTVLAMPGKTYRLTVTLPNCDYQVDFVCGYAIDTFGPAGSNIFYTPQNRLISADNDGTQVCAASSISGTVFVDKNADCKQQSGESGISGVTVTLTGTDFAGNAVSLTTKTDSRGNYSFTGLQASDARGYTITELQPSGYTHEGQTAGSTGGTTGDHTITTFLNTNTNSTANNFCEITPTPACDNLVSGDTATIGFWNNRNGQALINSLNGGASSKALGNWLATSFPNLYGSSAGSDSLAGKTNAQVGDYFQTLFSVRGQKTYAQVMANALAVYVTNSSLAGGNYAASYGFNVSSHGTGTSTYNVGSYASTLGVAANSTVFQILQAINAKSSKGDIPSSILNVVNTVADGINTKGDI